MTSAKNARTETPNQIKSLQRPNQKRDQQSQSHHDEALFGLSAAQRIFEEHAKMMPLALSPRDRADIDPRFQNL